MNKDRIKEYFETHPEQEQVHATSDGFLFERKDHAEAHGNTLDDKKVDTSYKKDFEAVDGALAALCEIMEDALKPAIETPALEPANEVPANTEVPALEAANEVPANPDTIASAPANVAPPAPSTANVKPKRKR